MPSSYFRSRGVFGSLVLACILQAGCVTLPVLSGKVEHAPVEGIQRIHAMWENRVFVTQDTVNNGTALPGVAGRLWLFGANDFTLRTRGELTVDLYDAAPVAKGGEPALLERWVIDPDTLDRLARKGVLGWEYTLFLPWGSYKAETREIMLQAKFVPETGAPLFTPRSPVNLLPPEHGPTLREQTIRPVVRQANPPAASQPLQVERLPWAR